MILAGGDSIEEANSFAGIDGGLRSCPLKSVEPFEGWKVEGRKRKSDQPATSDEQRRKKGCSSSIKIPTVKRDNEIDGAIGSPFLDLADVRGQGCLVHGAMKDLASSRHGGTENERLLQDNEDRIRAKGKGALDQGTGCLDSRDCEGRGGQQSEPMEEVWAMEGHENVGALEGGWSV